MYIDVAYCLQTNVVKYYRNKNMSNRFVQGYFYHIFNKSISNFQIFGRNENKQRFLNVLDYYDKEKINLSFSAFLKDNEKFKANILSPKNNSFVKFISYSIMPDHYHLLVKLLRSNFLSKYIGTVENSYTRYFDLKSSRRGPLWQSEFKCVLIQSNEQLLHVSRYIHLNPVTNYLVNKPEDWEYSSYNDYMNKNILKKYLTEISIKSPKLYKKFVDNQINYQRKLKMIKKLILE